MPLTDIGIRKAKPVAKPYKLFDGRGLHPRQEGADDVRALYSFSRLVRRFALTSRSAKSRADSGNPEPRGASALDP